MQPRFNEKWNSNENVFLNFKINKNYLSHCGGLFERSNWIYCSLFLCARVFRIFIILIEYCTHNKILLPLAHISVVVTTNLYRQWNMPACIRETYWNENERHSCARAPKPTRKKDIIQRRLEKKLALHENMSVAYLKPTISKRIFILLNSLQNDVQNACKKWF